MKPWPVALARSVDKRTEEELPLDITVMTRTALDHVLGECVCGGGGGCTWLKLGYGRNAEFFKIKCVCSQIIFTYVTLLRVHAVLVQDFPVSELPPDIQYKT